MRTKLLIGMTGLLGLLTVSGTAWSAKLQPQNMGQILGRIEGCLEVTVSTMHHGREHFQQEVQNANDLVREVSFRYGSLPGLEHDGQSPLFRLQIDEELFERLSNDPRVQGIAVHSIVDEPCR